MRETRLSQILANTTAVVYVKDRDGHYLLANRRFERLFGLPAGHPVGKTDAELDLFDADTVRVLQRNDARVLEQSAAIEYEETITVAGGARTYLSIKFPLFNTEGEAYAVCGISTDITEREQVPMLIPRLSRRPATAALADRGRMTLLRRTFLMPPTRGSVLQTLTREP